MPHTLTDFRSVAMASFAAGPLFLFGLAIGGLIADPASPIAVDVDPDVTFFFEALVGIPIALVVVMMAGGILAVLPNLIGTTIMAWLSVRNDGARLPVVWGIAGGLMSSAIAIVVIGDDYDLQPAITAALAFTGVACALICRYGISRADPVEIPWSRARPIGIAAAR